MDYIVLSIPIFFILIGVELLVSKMQKSNLYRFNDAITNISCGIVQQVTGVFTKTMLVVGYLYIYQHWRLFELEENWVTWIALFLGIDFFYYWFHRMAHEISLFWGTHIVHHQSEDYNLSVALRQSSLQGFVSMIFYLPLALIGFNPISFVAINAFQTLYQFWIHTETIRKLPAWFEYIFNTPSHHRVHHGKNPKYIDKNHGGTLIIFDRLFGTFQAEEEEVVYGVTKPLASWNPIWANLDWYADLWRDLKRPMSWVDRLYLLFAKPGWLPDHLGGYRSPPEIDDDSRHRFDIELPHGLNYYVLIQYLVVLGLTSAFLFNIDHFSYGQQIVMACLILFSVTNLGGLFELKPWSQKLEFLRWLIYLFVPLTFLEWSEYRFLVALVAALGIVSLYWFWQYRENFQLRKTVNP